MYRFPWEGHNEISTKEKINTYPPLFIALFTARMRGGRGEFFCLDDCANKMSNRPNEKTGGLLLFGEIVSYTKRVKISRLKRSSQKGGNLMGEVKKPVLVVMAAGMGSRYGGLKQIDPVDEYGNIIMDFSIFDAREAGFEKVVFIIKKAIEKELKENVGRRGEQYVETEYVYQELDRVPKGVQVPKERVKPWGTGHAILCCKDVIDGPFAVINADDYYGKQAFKEMYKQLTTYEDNEKYQYAMVGYQLNNTMTENGYVARGVCVIDENGKLKDIHERTRIEKRGDDGAYTEDDGATWNHLPGDSVVSMNLWGFTESILGELEKRFGAFLEKGLVENPLKCEYFLPFVVDEILKEDKAEVTVLKSRDRWYGVTYKEDKETVIQAVRSLKEQGLYPEKLWEV